MQLLSMSEQLTRISQCLFFVSNTFDVSKVHKTVISQTDNMNLLLVADDRLRRETVSTTQINFHFYIFLLMDLYLIML